MAKGQRANCPICAKEFAKDYIPTHIKREHDDSKNRFICGKCGAKCAIQVDLDRHLRDCGAEQLKTLHLLFHENGLPKVLIAPFQQVFTQFGVSWLAQDSVEILSQWSLRDKIDFVTALGPLAVANDKVLKAVFKHVNKIRAERDDLPIPFPDLPVCIRYSNPSKATNR